MNEAIAGIIGTIVGAVAAFFLVRTMDRQGKRDAESQAKEILERAERDAASRVKEIELETKEKMLQRKADAEKEVIALREESRERERLLDKRHETIEQQNDDLRKQEKIVQGTQKRLTDRLEETSKRNEELDQILETQRQKLQELSGMSREEATEKLLTSLDEELKQETGAMILRHERSVAETADAKGREILLTALHRYAAAHTAENTTSTVDIPNDEMKGRIIGREGRNIRSFEKATGVDVIIDDTPGVVIVSGFDPVRR